MPIDPGPSRWAMPTPPPSAGDFLGIGADLEPATLLDAYAGGLFPMPEGPDEIGWWSPRHRGVLPLDGLRVSRSLRASVRRYEVRVDTAFAAVVAGCADPARDGSWIDDRIAGAYRRLHELGWAHSVETWHDGELVGGLYGIAIGGLFAGESMYSRSRDASKVALVGLVGLLADEHAAERVIDTQWRTDHLGTLGVVEIPRASYLERLERALRLPLPAAFG
ncbi:leucyl/phenylalanyl-tRNA--protein transferase [Nocardioides marmoriginsengisoli]|uniref:Leucyl/phenylalanyl-tRNA--protein transferase n=1 Tax=Nocardioides marmoriginsengisoli TaxID=661483 RepID=A0A3N0CF06_9ACTN|nr:leucyl/phenylalanyl-tRNA--protein transferase [Nocardioides marmoriginsengisoli]RNL62040.1 leucyl/phenylalanyl-tRNA--protein transferase [Nocardioides marmoriginsengisoli]